MAMSTGAAHLEQPEDRAPLDLTSIVGTSPEGDSLDRLIHERMRLGIVSALAVAESMSFNDLKAALNATDGNLSVHAKRLEEAGYVSCQKTFDGRQSRTEFRLTKAGRDALSRYLDHMEALIRAMRRG